ncbi:LLM class flavin-dependent oxidoreductase [Pseudoclavibacter chungangensis]|uniref:LLM class flavin-dependent oxidoreductase n=1 Tax=Pseudoclavibacter chungangensis TaxID=587635 RepID=A0A7J5BZ60_9MICO|nr:LLM class flavin-dependent oxidoreductase [Pseudoclavibacter chungangensis]KAB1659424.1 LLM class flavin-dependent oxidoreductase [Pseudoclavibacter chungangensis]NYJ67733.1 alkanesulfonate monooxygenase SsuD/methylene tetrahydromethanopterin reductase-like flavin-dependent oxidoreductase (luciferase family) [Pseudoclavibacter chungangensis]
MSTPRVPLSILELSAFGSGQTPADGLRATIELAARAEQLGYRRLWLAEHHLNPGISGSAPHVLLPLLAAATSRLRVGTAATILGNSTPLQVAEQLGLVAALNPGRVDLGIGRTPSLAARAERAEKRTATEPVPTRVVDGLVIPTPPPFSFDLARFRAQAELLRRSDDDGDRFEAHVRDIIAAFEGTLELPDGSPIHATPAEGQDVQVWIHGSTAGPSAALAGALGLPFGANYHVAPSAVLDAVARYRESFVPGDLERPYVAVSVDVVVAETDAEARRLGAGYAAWVHSIRTGRGAIPFPTPEEALANPLTPEEEVLVRDRLDTRFVGSPETVRDSLETLQRVTGADELLVTTITHDPADRLRSFALLAEAWGLEAGAVGDRDAKDAAETNDTVGASATVHA